MLEKEKAILKERTSKAILKEAHKYQLNDNTTLIQKKEGKKMAMLNKKQKKTESVRQEQYYHQLMN